MDGKEDDKVAIGMTDPGSSHVEENLTKDIAVVRVALTEEDNRRICRKTDKVILAILVWVYFLQILDKTMLGFSALFGLQEATGLVGNQYSVVGSMAPIAQLIWQPFSSFLIVKVPHRILMPTLLLGWGVVQSCTPACTSFAGLVACRFFLGLFEAGCLPLFSVITAQWYRRAEQPLRVAAWYGTNGIATIIAAVLSYGLGKINSTRLAPWQTIFLSTGLLTVLSVPFVYWKLDNDIASARFLTEQERAQALERLRANQGGAGSREFKWSHVLESLLDIKTYLWIGMSLGSNIGAQVTVTFGPLILNGLGFDKYTTSLLNIPFGAIQFLVIMGVAYCVRKVRWKSVMLVTILLPILVGLVLLYVLPRTPSNTGPLLFGFYLLALIFGCNTLIVSWVMANTGGQTKKSVVIVLYAAASSAGNIIGPLLYNSADAPSYHPGLRSTLGVYVMIICIVIIQAGNLVFLNKLQTKKRVANGKPAKIHDHSMEQRYVEFNADNDASLGNIAFADLTDKENDEFIYVY